MSIIKNSMKKLKEGKQIVYSNLNRITNKSPFFVKIIISSWISFIILKKFYMNNLFVYNQAAIQNSLIIIGIMTFIFYFLIESLLIFIKKI